MLLVRSRKSSVPHNVPGGLLEGTAEERLSPTDAVVV